MRGESEGAGHSTLWTKLWLSKMFLMIDAIPPQSAMGLRRDRPFQGPGLTHYN